jgi:Ca2+-binding RTX toxin-like protein
MIIEGTDYPDELWGTFEDDEIAGYGDNDNLYGLGGEDLMDGGRGHDGLYGDWGDDFLFGGPGHDRLEGGDDNDRLIGAEDDDELYGGAGDDWLDSFINNRGEPRVDGWDGAEILEGGTGNDLYGVDDPGDVVTEFAWEGIDRVVTFLSYTLPDHVEHLTLNGSGTPNGTGNVLDNQIVGSDFANVLSGLDGNDTLDGGGGADTLIGAIGNDTYVVDNAGDVMTELVGEGTDRVVSSISFALADHFENLSLTGSASVNGTGNAANNTITGNAGANTLDGGTGADTMRGGDGNDTYVLDNASDVVTEFAGGGTDTVRSGLNHTLGAHVENLELTGSATRGTGNALNNIITGNGQGNTLIGGDGHDTLVGRSGSDLLTGGAGNDLFRFNAPSDGGVKGGDAITDFVRGQDYIALDHAGFGIGGTGSLASQGVAFVRGTAATSTAPSVIVTPLSNDVWWDADGTGVGRAQPLAHVSLPAFGTLDASDFLIV